MSESNHLKKIAVVGASGNVGTPTLKNLLEINPDIEVTVVSRPDSKATFPTSKRVTVVKGSYDDASFLQSAFAGHDLVLLALSFTVETEQPKLIDAAAKAGVKWIIPNEYAGDGFNETMRSEVPVFKPKATMIKYIEDLAKTYPGLKWIGVATNPWTELSVQWGMFGFNLKDRVATLWSGAGSFNTSSINQVGLGIAKLLSLPITSSSNPRASLEHYANNFVYISSFQVTQDKLFDSIKRASNTTDADWKIERSTISDSIKSNRDQFAKGNGRAGASVAYGYYMGDGMGGDYEHKAKEDRDALGLKEENLDEVVKRCF